MSDTHNTDRAIGNITDAIDTFVPEIIGASWYERLHDAGDILRDAYRNLVHSFCLAPSPNGYICTEPANHAGWHRAHLYEKLCDHWPPDKDIP